jgi:hypothetical protein
LAISPRVADESVRKPDRVAGALAAGFVVILLATEAVLTLPDETANPRTAASFYATHRAFIISLQLLGVVAADDILFVGIVLFAGAVAVRLGRRLPALGLLALFVAVSCLIRLGLEIAGNNRRPLDAIGPLSFVLLIAVMAILSFLGLLRSPLDAIQSE